MTDLIKATDATVLRRDPNGGIFIVYCPNCGQHMHIHENGERVCQCGLTWFIVVTAQAVEGRKDK